MDYLARLTHFLLPQESNNQKAKILHHSSLSSIIGLFLFVQLLISGVMIVKPAVLGFASQISPERVVELTNAERAKAGLPPLTLNSKLSEAAQRKAGDMFAFDYWAHNSPSGRDPWSFFREVGYRYLYAGENLARDFSSPEAVVSAWMASSTHRDNLLNPKYQEIGISVVDGTLGGAQTTLVVQHFGTSPSSTAQVPSAASQIKTEEKPKETMIAQKKPEPVQEVSPYPTTPPASGPTLVPTPTPTLLPIADAKVTRTPNLAGSIVLSQAKGTEKSLVNPFSFTREASLVILFVLLGIIVLDGVAAYRKRILRLSGKSLAHFLFLSGILLIVILSSQGLIL